MVSACSTVARRSALLGSFQVAVGKYMLALYRCGRRGDALAAFHRLRRALIDELGLEPSRAVQRLHQGILATDPALEAVTPVQLGAAA